MSTKICCFAVVLLMSMSMPFAHAQRGSKEGGKPGGKEGAKQEGNKQEGNKDKKNSGRNEPAGKAPGGNWSESKQQPQLGRQGTNAAGAKSEKYANEQEPKAAAGAAAANRNEPKTSGATSAAAGAAAANRNEPKASGAAGVATGATAANRNESKTSGAAGVAAGAAAANRNEPKASGAAGIAVADSHEHHAAQADHADNFADVRSSFERSDLYGQAWHEANPNVWRGTNWAAGSEWTAAPWGDVASHLGYGSQNPASFDFGSNVNCVNGNIIQDGKEIATAEEFSQQAFELAKSGAEAQPAADGKWLPLGVFAMVQNEQQHPHLVMQLAIDQAGNLRGNYSDTVTDTTQPLQGGVDNATQRVAWTVGNSTNSVLEAGLSNLTNGNAPALLHKNGKTERWILVRLPKPE